MLQIPFSHSDVSAGNVSVDVNNTSVLNSTIVDTVTEITTVMTTPTQNTSFYYGGLFTTDRMSPVAVAAEQMATVQICHYSDTYDGSLAQVCLFIFTFYLGSESSKFRRLCKWHKILFQFGGVIVSKTKASNCLTVILTSIKIGLHIGQFPIVPPLS